MKIKKKNTIALDFFAITVLTIAVTRIFLGLIWNTAFMQAQQADAWHHSYTGLLLAVAAYILPSRFRRYAVAIGVGLFIDESYFLHRFIGISECAGYWSTQAYVSIFAWLTILFVCLKYNLANILLRRIRG